MSLDVRVTDDRRYPNGVPSWVDTEQSDVEAAQRFYGGLFDWTFTQAMPPGVPGSYLIAALDGHDVSAIGLGDSDGGARWNTYIACDDADATAAAVRSVRWKGARSTAGRRPGRPDGDLRGPVRRGVPPLAGRTPARSTAGERA